jgi:hypothetical protein
LACGRRPRAPLASVPAPTRLPLVAVGAGGPSCRPLGRRLPSLVGQVGLFGKWHAGLPGRASGPPCVHRVAVVLTLHPAHVLRSTSRVFVRAKPLARFAVSQPSRAQQHRRLGVGCSARSGLNPASCAPLCHLHIYSHTATARHKPLRGSSCGRLRPRGKAARSPITPVPGVAGAANRPNSRARRALNIARRSAWPRGKVRPRAATAERWNILAVSRASRAGKKHAGP